MNQQRERALAFALCIITSLAALAPTLMAARAAQPAEFSGFLINPIDGFSYLAKMRQGQGGAWLFRLPYAVNPGPGVLLYVYYLALGQLAGVFKLPLLVVFHTARFLAACFMFWMSFLFCKRMLAGMRAQWAAFLLILTSAGLGWLALPLGIQASDLSIPESIPFLAAYTNAHFPLACGLILASVLVVEGQSNVRLRAAASGVLGLSLGAVLPFSLASLLFFLGGWLVTEIGISLRQQDWRRAWLSWRGSLIPFVALVLGALPWLVYGVWILLHHSEIASWTTQNLTPSPPVHDYIIGFGGVLLLACVTLLRGKLLRDARGRLLAFWAIGNFLLLYAPIGLQRRLSLGLYFPLVCLAVMALEAFELSRSRYRLLFVSLWVISIPSIILMIVAGLSGVQQRHPTVVHTHAEMTAYSWISDDIPPGSVILASPEVGNRLPAFANVRVLYGHPFETPDAEDQKQVVLDLFQWTGDREAGLRWLETLGVDYIFYGSREKELGPPWWDERAPRVFQAQEVEIFRVIGE